MYGTNVYIFVFFVKCSAPSEPVCVRDTDPMASALRRDRNPEPFTVVQCPPPPVYQDRGLIAVQDSGDKVIVSCLPGYFIEGTSFMVVMKKRP